MPELPEVETIRRGLHDRVVGSRILRVVVRERRLRLPVTTDFADRLAGRTLRDVRRRSKYLLLGLDDGSTWVVHLGMSGKLIHVPSDLPPEKHDHVVATLEPLGELRLNDPRRFGLSVLLGAEELESWPPLRSLGPDPFDHAFGGAYLWERVHRSHRAIKDILMDQTVVAGLGNIYVNEVLFRAGIRPATRGPRLRRDAVERIARLVPVLLREAIRWCGTSISDYRDGEDREGRFQEKLRVYDREGKPCRVCRTPVVRVVWGNRGSYYCPTCQR